MGTDEVRPAPRHHHGVTAAEEFRKQNAEAYGIQSEAPLAAEPVAPATQPATTAPAVPPAVAAPESQPAQPAEAAIDNIFQFKLVPPSDVQDEDTAAPDQDRPGRRELELQQEVEELRARYSELTAAQKLELEKREEERKELEELRAYRRQKHIDSLLDTNNLELDSVDPAVAKELVDKVLRPALDRQQQAYEGGNEEIRKALAEEKAAREELAKKAAEAEKNRLQEATNKKIFAAHPDFRAINNSREFKRFLASTIEGTNTRLDSLVAGEYYRGNADFVISVVNQFKNGRPNLEDIASVQASGTGSAPANGGSEEPEYTDDDVAEWNTQMVRGEISREEFREKMAKYRAARAPVKQAR